VRTHLDWQRLHPCKQPIKWRKVEKLTVKCCQVHWCCGRQCWGVSDDIVSIGLDDIIVGGWCQWWQHQWLVIIVAAVMHWGGYAVFYSVCSTALQLPLAGGEQREICNQTDFPVVPWAGERHLRWHGLERMVPVAKMAIMVGAFCCKFPHGRCIEFSTETFSVLFFSYWSKE